MISKKQLKSENERLSNEVDELKSCLEKIEAALIYMNAPVVRKSGDGTWCFKPSEKLVKEKTVLMVYDRYSIMPRAYEGYYKLKTATKNTYYGEKND